jgi:hypothetical protein
MNGITRHLVRAAIAAITIVGTTAVRAADGDSPRQQNTYVVTPLVSNLAGKAKFQDRVLQNSWGVAFTPARRPQRQSAGDRRVMDIDLGRWREIEF